MQLTSYLACLLDSIETALFSPLFVYIYNKIRNNLSAVRMLVRNYSPLEKKNVSACLSRTCIDCLLRRRECNLNFQVVFQSLDLILKISYLIPTSTSEFCFAAANT